MRQTPEARPVQPDAAGTTQSGPIVLIGMMGTGKTTVAVALAHRLGWPVHDSDVLVQSATGRTVTEIFAADGEAAFRRYETDALAQALEAPRAGVVAAAGGVVLDADNRARLRAASATGLVVWLRADPLTLVRRVAGSTHRPLLDAESPAATLETLASLAKERRALYAEVADAVIDVDEVGVDEIVAWILQRLHARP